MNLLPALAPLLFAASDVSTEPTPQITGKYLEVRSCDVYTGPCFANAEMGSDGKEAMLVWSIDRGAWKGSDLSGLSVIAVVRAGETLGDLKYAEPRGRAVFIVDEKATCEQRKALLEFAAAGAGNLIGETVRTEVAPIETTIGNCAKTGACASVSAGDLLSVDTRCLCDDDHVCGNEYRYYPPLTGLEDATAAFVDLFSYQGEGLGIKWATTGIRGAYVGQFAL